MKKITLNQHQPELPENGLAIDESLIPRPDGNVGTNVSKTGVRLVDAKEAPMAKRTQSMMTLMLVIAVIAGIGTGFGINKLSAQRSFSSDGEISPEEIQVGSPTGNVKVGDVYGSAEEANFKDSVEGVIVLGGVEGEGSHHLVRPGGDSQNVYLTSSVVDLSQFEGHKVKVWGETFAAQKAGWLMDVGRARVLELDAELPSEK